MIFLRDDSPDVTPMQRAEAAMQAYSGMLQVAITSDVAPAVGKIREVMVATGRGMGKSQISQRLIEEFRKEFGGMRVVSVVRDEASQSRLYNHHTAGPASDDRKPCEPKWSFDYMTDILEDMAEQEKKDQAKATAKGQGFCPKGHKMKGGFCRRCSR